MNIPINKEPTPLPEKRSKRILCGRFVRNDNAASGPGAFEFVCRLAGQRQFLEIVSITGRGDPYALHIPRAGVATLRAALDEFDAECARNDNP